MDLEHIGYLSNTEHFQQLKKALNSQDSQILRNLLNYLNQVLKNKACCSLSKHLLSPQLSRTMDTQILISKTKISSLSRTMATQIFLNHIKILSQTNISSLNQTNINSPSNHRIKMLWDKLQGI